MIRTVSFDLETEVIASGMLFPAMVCGQFGERVDGEVKTRVLKPFEFLLEFRALLQDPDVTFCTHNGAFDFGVVCAEAPALIPLVFAAYDADRIHDSMIRSMLVDIAQGNFQEVEGQRRGAHYGLDKLSARWLKEFLKKEDTWRLKYALLKHTPLADWPADALEYAHRDADVTLRVNEEISAWARREGQDCGTVPDQFRQTRAAFALHLMAGWGVRTEEQEVVRLKAHLEQSREAAYATMDQWGLFKRDRKGEFVLTETGQRSKNLTRLKELIKIGFDARGEIPTMTEGRINKKTGERVPEISTSAETAEDSLQPGAVAYAEAAGYDKLLGTYVPALFRGFYAPLTSSPNILVASGRTSWAHPNLQNPPQKHGVRECFVPRKGRVYVGADLDTVELRALAQCCLELYGYSEMAEALLRGEDLHLSLAAELLGITYSDALRRYQAGDPEVEAARQISKAVNFGLPGGMGIARFASTFMAKGTPLVPGGSWEDQLARAKFLKDTWFRRWPEMREHLKNASNITGDFGSCMVVQPWSERVRGGLNYSAAANTYFQGRVADGVKLALWDLAKACYLASENSVLYGCRPVLFLHDEVILECDEGMEHEVGLELVRVLCAAVGQVIPEVPITSTSVATRRWYKGAKPAKVDGRLVPSKPEGRKWVPDVCTN